MFFDNKSFHETIFNTIGPNENAEEDLAVSEKGALCSQICKPTATVRRQMTRMTLERTEDYRFLKKGNRGEAFKAIEVVYNVMAIATAKVIMGRASKNEALYMQVNVFIQKKL